MKHLNRYNEEWNPLKDIAKYKSKKIVDNIVETIGSVKSSYIDSVEVKKNGDTTFYINLTVSPQKVEQLKLESGKVEVKYYGYKREEDTNITIVVQEVKFRMNTGITEAKYFGGREKSVDFSYTDPKVGNIHVYPTMILIDRYSTRLATTDLGYVSIPYDKNTIKSGFTKFFEDNIGTLPNLLSLVKKSIEERKVVVAKEREESDKHMSKVKQFIENKEAIQECFYDIIDMSDDYKITPQGNTVLLTFNIKGIDIKSQEKSKSSYDRRSVNFEFDEAHIGITDEIINVFSAIRDAKAHLLSLDENVVMDTIFKKNRLEITLKIIKK